MGRIIKSEANIEVRPSCGEFPELGVGQPAGVTAEHARRDIASGLAQLSYFRRKLPRQLQIGPADMVHPLAPQSEQERAGPLQRRRELPRPGVGLTRIAGAIPLAFDQRLAERDLQIELAL